MVLEIFKKWRKACELLPKENTLLGRPSELSICGMLGLAENLRPFVSSLSTQLNTRLNYLHVSKSPQKLPLSAYAKYFYSYSIITLTLPNKLTLPVNCCVRLCTSECS